MQPAAEQDPFSGSGREPCLLSLPLTEGGEWTVSFAPELAKCVGRYARIPEFAYNSHLLNISSPSPDGLN